MPVGYKVADAQLKGEKPALVWRMLHPLAKFMLFDPLKDKLGFSKSRYAFTTGALLGPDVFRMITPSASTCASSTGQQREPAFPCT